jgi:hypothetical protein
MVHTIVKDGAKRSGVTRAQYVDALYRAASVDDPDWIWVMVARMVTLYP